MIRMETIIANRTAQFLRFPLGSPSLARARPQPANNAHKEAQRAENKPKKTKEITENAVRNYRIEKRDGEYYARLRPKFRIFLFSIEFSYSMKYLVCVHVMRTHARNGRRKIN